MTPIPTVEEAQQRQAELAALVEVPRGVVPQPATVAGLDVSYAVGSDAVVAAAVVVRTADGAVLDEALARGTATFPYLPGLLAFREVPMLLRALEGLSTAPDPAALRRQELAHPRRCGVACHLGVLTGVAAGGCAKSRFVGEHDDPGPRRGDRAPLVARGDVVGEVLRTQDGVRPVYVSLGHRIGVAQASDVVLALCSRFRLPDPVRRADAVSRRALRASG